MTATGVFVPVSEVFPDVAGDFETFRRLLGQLSRTDTLFWCARFNLILSNPTNTDHRSKQQYVLSTCLRPQEIERINRFAQRHGGVDKIAVFFRGQLLELLRWACVLSADHAGDGNTFENLEKQRAFAQAALIASDLWAQRIYGDRMSVRDGVAAARQRALGSLRQSIAETSSGMHPLLALGRGTRLISERLFEFYPPLEEEFRSKTGLSLNEYYVCLAMIMTHVLDVTPENAEARGLGIFNVTTLSRDVPQLDRIVSAYLTLESQTAEELKNALYCNEEPLDPFSLPSVKPLRRKPILRAIDGRAIIMDPVFYAERASAGPLFLISEGADRSKSEQIFSAFGYAFEAYAGEILQAMYPKTPVLVNRLRLDVRGRDSRGNQVQIADACLNDVTDIVLVEAKARWVVDDKVLDQDYETYLEHLRDRYGAKTTGNATPTGVAQLARAITNLASGEWNATDEDFSQAERIYPVLLVHDQLLDAPVHGQFLAGEFQRALYPDKAPRIGDMQKGRFRITPLILMTIEDLENLETSTRHFALRDLLCEYSAACPDRMESLHDFIARSSFGREIRYSQSLAAKTLETLQQAVLTMGGSTEVPV